MRGLVVWLLVIALFDGGVWVGLETVVTPSAASAETTPVPTCPMVFDPATPGNCAPREAAMPAAGAGCPKLNEVVKDDSSVDKLNESALAVCGAATPTPVLSEPQKLGN